MTSYASSRDVQPIEGEVNYYGVLIDIVELNYPCFRKIVLFRCDWIDLDRGCKKEKFGFTLVNFSHLTHNGSNLVDEPFILASQAQKVFYIKDEWDNGWVVVKHAKLRDTFDMGDREGSTVSNQKAVEMQGTEVDELNASGQERRRFKNSCFGEILKDLDKEDSMVKNVQDLPVGDVACKSTRFMGTIVRNSDSAPINYISWSQMPVDKKEEMWKTIKEKFVFQKLGSDEFVDEEEMEHIKAWALEDMSSKWRAWKNELKSKYFDEEKTSVMDQSAKNRENRSKSDQPHFVGTKSFPRLIQTMTEEANGIHPSRADVYIHSQTRKDGNIVNEKAAQVVDRIQKIRIETNDDSLEASWDKDVYFKANGPEKKVQQNQEVEGLRTEVHGLKNVAPDAMSAPEISPIRNNRSLEITHQPSQHQDDILNHELGHDQLTLVDDGVLNLVRL
ncbi:Transposase, Ptta/En/Spm, plant [Corchorus capsularis]|uniref:Transposase, Ptta/En/Spm, plant n=1 Tax=Corchorus capsularis TaxID=210143 RepID=A0A1R3HQQ3_COCAP|nr:Transposase, Ptta/En/Spm, plant [Corchorus capsularis]